MPVQFPTQNYDMSGNWAQAANIGLSPLNALMSGRQEADMQQMRFKALQDAEEMIRQRQLENRLKDWEVKVNTAKEQDPDYLPSLLLGQKAQGKLQDISLQEKQAGLPGQLDTTNLMNRFKKAQSIATDTNASPETRAAAIKELQDSSKILGLVTPEHIAATDLQQTKLANKGEFSPAELVSIINLAASTGQTPQAILDAIRSVRGIPGQTQQQGGQVETPVPVKQFYLPPGTSDEKVAEMIKQAQVAQAAGEKTGNYQMWDTLMKQFPLPDKTVSTQQSPSLLNTPLEKKSNSMREARYSDVVAIAGNEAQAAIKNIVNMPVMSSSGIMGEDVKLSNSLFDAPIRTLKKKVNKDYENAYNAEVDNIGSYYARLLSGGLSVTQADMDKFTSQFRIKAGEDVLTAMTRMAQMRQSFERAAEIKLKSKTTPPEQMAMWEDAVKSVKESIPITVNDINEIRNKQHPENKTFSQVMQDMRGKDSVTVGDKTYQRPSNFSNKQWEDYKAFIGSK